MEWAEETIVRLRALWDEGLSTAEIGRRLGVSKNAVVGKAHRLDLPARPTALDLENLVQEISACTEEAQVAWRAPHRYVARLVRHRSTGARVQNGPFRLQLTQYGSPEFLRLAQ